jgi:hypothetical protein
MDRQVEPEKDSNCVITLESLNRIFEQSKNPATYIYHDKCDICGCSVKIEITKTSGGYGLIGGILYEQDPENINALCIGCHTKFKKLKRSG